MIRLIQKHHEIIRSIEQRIKNIDKVIENDNLGFSELAVIMREKVELKKKLEQAQHELSKV